MHTGIPDGAPEVIRLLIILHMQPIRHPPLGGYKEHKQVSARQYKEDFNSPSMGFDLY